MQRAAVRLFRPQRRGFWYTTVRSMTYILTRLCLVGAAVLFAAWLVLRGRNSFARELAAVRRCRAAFLVFVAVAAVYAQKPETGGNRLPQPSVRVASCASVPSVVELFRLESEITNDSYSYAIPTNGVRYENWSLRGAYEDVFRLDLCGMPFPLGTNLCDSLWVYSWGMVGARLCDISNRVVATGAPMSAVPQVSRFWDAPAEGKV